MPPKENLMWEPLHTYTTYARIGPTHRRREFISPPQPRTMRWIMFYTRRNKWSMQMHFVANVFFYFPTCIYIYIMFKRIYLCERYFFQSRNARASLDAHTDNN